VRSRLIRKRTEKKKMKREGASRNMLPVLDCGVNNSVKLVEEYSNYT